jgi:hypothetical protein
MGIAARKPASLISTNVEKMASIAKTLCCIQGVAQQLNDIEYKEMIGNIILILEQLELSRA